VISTQVADNFCRYHREGVILMHALKRPRILILVKHYEPAFRLGGPIRSVVNLVAALHKEFEFKIICLNRDFRETRPLDGIEEGVWLTRGSVQVCYLDIGLLRPFKFIKTIRSIDYDMVYLNSFFDPLFSTLPALLMRIRLLGRSPIVMAPRGEFSPGALMLKSFKKRLFMRLQSLLGLYADAYWQATSALEAADIRGVFGDKIHVQMAPNLSTKDLTIQQSRVGKQAGLLRVVFLSRISPKKNLLALIQATGRLRGNINLDIWGPIDDAEYWRQCQREMALLPQNVLATYCGESRHESVPEVLGAAEVFALPTLGENYGHVIHEALSAGCPVVISDRTPWRDLANFGVGFDVSLEQIDDLVRSIQTFVDMDASEYGGYAERCREFAVRRSCRDTDIEANRQMFTTVLRAWQ
jgi:glycosyltransferase involved in cell wall biosynthesis